MNKPTITCIDLESSLKSYIITNLKDSYNLVFVKNKINSSFFGAKYYLYDLAYKLSYEYKTPIIIDTHYLYINNEKGFPGAQVKKNKKSSYYKYIANNFELNKAIAGYGIMFYENPNDYYYYFKENKGMIDLPLNNKYKLLNIFYRCDKFNTISRSSLSTQISMNREKYSLKKEPVNKLIKFLMRNCIKPSFTNQFSNIRKKKNNKEFSLPKLKYTAEQNNKPMKHNNRYSKFNNPNMLILV
jgi:hypothetical protein